MQNQPYCIFIQGSCDFSFKKITRHISSLLSMTKVEVREIASYKKVKKAERQISPDLIILQPKEKEVNGRMLRWIDKQSRKSSVVVVSNIANINTRQAIYDNKALALLTTVDLSIDKLVHEVTSLEPVHKRITELTFKPYREQIANIPCPAIMIEQKGNIVAANIQAEDLVNFELDALKPINFFNDVMPVSKHDSFKKVLERVKKNNDAANFKISDSDNHTTGNLNIWVTKSAHANKDRYYFTLTLNRYIESRLTPIQINNNFMGAEFVSKRWPEIAHAAIIDSDSTSQMVLKSHLERLCLASRSYWSLNDSLSDIQNKHFDVILIDEEMLETGPVSTIVTLQKISAAPIIVITSSTLAETPMINQMRLADGLVLKPFTHKQIKSVLADHILSLKKIIDDGTLRKIRLEQIESLLPDERACNQVDKLIDTQVSGILDRIDRVVETMVSSSANTEQISSLASMVRENCDANDDSAVSTLEHLVLSMITARQIQQMRSSVEKIHTIAG